MTNAKYSGTTREFALEDKGQPRQPPNGADRRLAAKQKKSGPSDFDGKGVEISDTYLLLRSPPETAQ